MAQQQIRSNVTQDAAAVPTYPVPSSYYSYPATYSTAQAAADVAVNERVSRAAPTENSVTDTPSPKTLETLPLDIIKHAVQHNKDNNHHHHHHHHQHKKTLANTTTTAVELPIACPKCGAKMKLLLSLASADGQTHDVCTCEDNKPKYFCECAQPQICAICNKVKKYTTDYNWKQQPHSIIVLRKTNPATTPRRNVFSAPPPPTTTTMQPISYDGNGYMWAQSAVEPTITKRYAVVPSSENVVYAGGYEQQQQQEISNLMNAVYEAVEHQPTCYCWRCRFIRRY